MAAQKSSQIGDIASEELVSSTKDKRETLYRIVLHRCLPDLVTDLDFSAVSDYIKEMKLFDDSTMLDILNEGEPPDKTRALIKQIEQRNYDTYEKFKQCLVLAKQENVKDMLEHNETIATIQLNTKHEARQTENLHRIVLNRSLPDLVRFLDLYALDGYYRSMRHYDEILGERTTAGKIGLLIKHIKNRGYDTYERFKRCLVMSNQAHVRDMLEKVENIVKIELKTKHEVLRTDTTDIPAEILTMDDQSIRLFTEALKRGTVSVYNIRVMVVGHLGVGKTTLIKRLLGEEVTIGQKLSTDGIVVHVQCCRVSRDTLKWTLNKGDSEQDHRMQLLKKVLNEKQVDKDVDKKPLTYNDSADSVQGKQGLEQFQNSLYKSSINRINRSGLDIDSHKTDPVKETLQIFQTHYATLTPDLGNYAPLTMYDFGGEYAFYTTHQMFITQRAIYLLVSDLGRNISSEVEDVFYFDCEGEIPCSVQKLVEVWMNFIHTCAPPGKETINYTPPDKVIPPPVILVGTHTDAIPQKRRQECERYFTTIRSHLSDRPSRFHLVNEDFAIDNTVVDSRLEDLKRKIVEVASQQPYWGEKRPAMWLPLEQALMNLKAKGIKVISLGDMEDFNRVGAFHMSSEDLDLFLRFQHDIGTIIYFSTDVLKDNIVLDPQWMIDALTSLITARTFVLTKYVSVADKWLEFERNGKLFPELVDAIWTKENNKEFCDNKKHILLLMEHLNVIAKPRLREKDGSESEANYFFAPCMLRQKTPDEIICPKLDSQMESSSVFCFVFVEKFLPSPIFHRLLAACLTKWPLAKKKGTLENLIFCGSGVFQLDEYHRLTLYFKDYVIFMRVTRKGIRDKTPSSAKCIEVRKFVKAKLVQLIGSPGNNLTFQKFIQCPESNGNDVRNLISVIQLKKEVEAGCDIHEHTLDSRELLKFWYKVEQSGNGDAGQLHEIVLNLCLPTLLKYFDFSLCCDYISQKGLLDEATMRDISTMEPVSEQTRTLIENIQQRGPEIYEIFKECLFESEQGHLKDDLEKEEARLKGKLHEFVLNRCMPTLLKDFDFSLCCDYISRKGLLDELTMRDISKMNTTSEQTRELIENIQQRGPKIYEMFKECLVESGQGRLKHILEKEEAQRKGTLHELVLNHCMPSLVKDFIFSPCCDYIVQNELFGGVTMNDIADTNPSSKRTRTLIQKVKQGSPETYEKFKVCLVKSGQEHLKVLLEEEEARCTDLSNHELTQAETLGTATKPEALAVAVPTVQPKPKGWIGQESKVETKRTKRKGQKTSTSLTSVLTITKLSPKCKAPTPAPPDI